MTLKINTSLGLGSGCEDVLIPETVVGEFESDLGSVTKPGFVTIGLVLSLLAPFEIVPRFCEL